jgi:hypothetical protein
LFTGWLPIAPDIRRLQSNRVRVSAIVSGQVKPRWRWVGTHPLRNAAWFKWAFEKRLHSRTERGQQCPGGIIFVRVIVKLVERG